MISNLRLWWYDVNGYDGCPGKPYYGIRHRIKKAVYWVSLGNISKLGKEGGLLLAGYYYV
ncbi:MAG TPA: hypothetical protein ENJ28_07045 [Gammaproteobacteria bacterium]|nr:hypothetical protein [Gammaproteobacteria bacterium]